MRHFLLVHFQLIVTCIIKHKNEIKNCQIYKASYHFIWNNFLLDLDQRIKSNQTLFICLFSQLITKILQCVPWKNQLFCFEIVVSIIRTIKISPHQPHFTFHSYRHTIKLGTPEHGMTEHPRNDGTPPEQRNTAEQRSTTTKLWRNNETLKQRQWKKKKNRRKRTKLSSLFILV